MSPILLPDDGVLIVATQLHYLQFVLLVDCHGVTDVGLEHLGTHRASTLKTVWLHEIASITEAGINNFRTLCPSAELHVIDVCANIRALEQLLSSNKTTLVEMWMRLTDVNVQSLVSLSDSVRTVWFCSIDVRHLSADGFVAFCRRMPLLSTVVCRGGRRSDILDSVREWVRALPHIKITTHTTARHVDVMNLPV